VSEAQVARQISDEEAATPGGPAEFKMFLKATTQSLADVRREARTRLLALRLRQNVLRGVSVTRGEIASYYRRHRSDFLLPEARRVEISNRKTRAAAEALRRWVEGGGSLLSRRQREVGETSLTAKSIPTRRNELEAAIYAARPHALTGPVLVGGHTYYMFRVIEVVPRARQALAQVRDSIRALLIGERRRQRMAAAVAAWRRRWIAVTYCAPEYAVQKCRRYGGPRRPEDPLNFD
jgi:hypothetical protein